MVGVAACAHAALAYTAAAVLAAVGKTVGGHSD